MNNQTATVRNTVFAAVILLFAMTFATFALGLQRFALTAVSEILFGLAGVALVVLTLRLREPRLQRVFFLMTGISAVGIPLSVALHNVVYALCILMFGNDFWKDGRDEPFFFLSAIELFAALFLIGSMGSAAILARAFFKRQS